MHTTNYSTYATTLEHRWDQGNFRWVHKGQYSRDPRIPGHSGCSQDGQLCVLKEFKTGSVYEEHFFTKDINAVDKANAIIGAFNAEVSYRTREAHVQGSKAIYLTKPTVWEDIFPDATGRKCKKLVEPMLEGAFIKFNSNSGYTNGAEFLQALSHFSYHHTNEKHLLCDLQGGHYQDCYILTDPVVMSTDNSKVFGAGDLGKEGIDNFFSHHKCNCLCQQWLKPLQPRASHRIPHTQGTSFSLTLGTAKSEAERLKALNAILVKKEPGSRATSSAQHY